MSSEHRKEGGGLFLRPYEGGPREGGGGGSAPCCLCGAPHRRRPRPPPPRKLDNVSQSVVTINGA